MSQKQLKELLKNVDTLLETKLFEEHTDSKNLKRMYKKNVKPELKELLESTLPKNTKRVKDPNEPKRPKPAYFCFQADMRTKAIEHLNKTNNKKLKPEDEGYVNYAKRPTEVSKYLSEKWNKMKNDPKQKSKVQKYIEEAEQDKKRYVEEKARYEQSKQE